jgi:hypothetical protein
MKKAPGRQPRGHFRVLPTTKGLPEVYPTRRVRGSLAELLARTFDADSLAHLAHLARDQERPRVIDPEETAVALASLLANDNRPSLGFWRRRLEAPRRHSSAEPHTATCGCPPSTVDALAPKRRPPRRPQPRHRPGARPDAPRLLRPPPAPTRPGGLAP